MESNETENSIIVEYQDPEVIFLGNPILNLKLDLNTIQFQMFIEMVASIKENDTQFNTYRLYVKDFATRIGVNQSDIYKVVRAAARGMIKPVPLIEADGSTSDVAFLRKANYQTKNGYVDLQFSDDLMPYLLGFDNKFFVSHMEATRRIRNPHLIKLYWFCVRWKNAPSMPITMSIIKLRQLLEVLDKYENYRDFKRQILYKGQEMFKLHGKVNFSFEEVRESGKNSEVIKLKFYIRENKPEWEVSEAKEDKQLPPKGESKEQKLITSIYEQIEIWGFEREEVENLLITYQSIDHIQDKINFVRAKKKKGGVENPKIYFLSLLNKEKNLISTESIKKINEKKQAKKQQENIKEQNALKEIEQKKQSYQKRADELAEAMALLKREKVAEFFENFPDVKTKICEEVAETNSFLGAFWSKSKGNLKLEGSFYSMVEMKIDEQYHIFDAIKADFEQKMNLLKNEMQLI